MATDERYMLNAAKIIKTSQLDAIGISTAGEKVEVRVVRSPEEENDELLHTTLYAYGGEAELTDIGRLIEDRYRELGLSLDTIAIEAGEHRLEFRALYCADEEAEGLDPERDFWTSARSAMVHAASLIAIEGLPTPADPYVIEGTLEQPAGDIVTASATSDSIGRLETSVASIGSLLRQAAQPQAEGARLTDFTIRRGAAEKQFFVTAAAEFRTFAFRNAYNCMEYVDITGHVKEKTEVSREMATSRGRAMQYDQHTERTWEVESSALTEDQARTAEQLMRVLKNSWLSSHADHHNIASPRLKVLIINRPHLKVGLTTTSRVLKNSTCRA